MFRRSVLNSNTRGNLIQNSLLLISILFLLTPNLYSDVRYVSKTGSSTPPYLTWETASDSIQKCINFCNWGDTVIVDKGTYYESILIDREISLLGLNRDSTIINSFDRPEYYCIRTIQNSIIKGFNFYTRLVNTVCVHNDYGNVVIENSIFSQYDEGVLCFGDSAKITNCTFKYSNWRAISTYSNKCYIENNIMIGKNYDAIALHDGITYIRNNIILSYGSRGTYGILCLIESLDELYITNNLISGFLLNMRIDISSYNRGEISNNVIAYQPAVGLDEYSVMTNINGKIRNNIFINNSRGINYWNNAQEDYNLFWNMKKNYSTSQLSPNDIIADPMVIKDTLPVSESNFDFHLQKFSPAIDKGDTSLIDIDGTRSDLGMYGGPYGEEYTYKDYAPASPKNLTAIVDTGKVILKWNRNTEADTADYSVYMDTSANFAADSTNLISKQKDSLFIYYNPQLRKDYYFKITATDKQGNHSFPSEEIHVFLTSAEENYPIEITDYRLYQNYPSPFNPTTKIPYRLKEKGNVKLLVYDIKGELIKILINKEQEQGYYEQVLDGKGLSSGIYLYRIEITGKGNIPVYSEMKKTILIK